MRGLIYLKVNACAARLVLVEVDALEGYGHETF